MKKIILLNSLIFLFLGAFSQTVTDIDGNVYNAVTIGTQTWLKENLKTTRYNDGKYISNLKDSTIWGNVSAVRCYYKNDSATYASTYGVLYNYHVVWDNSNVCPIGWHVPTDAEFVTLVNYLGGTSIAGGKLKEAGTSHWQSPNTGATNSSNFTALPGGQRSNYNGIFGNIGSNCTLWSSTLVGGSCTSSWVYDLYYNNTNFDRFGLSWWMGLPIRCIKNNGSGINETEKIINFITFPNPVNDHLSIHLSQINENTTLTIYDLLGKAIKSLPLLDIETTINVSGLSRGIYILEVATDKAIGKEKFVKE